MSSAIAHQAKPCAASLTGSSKSRSYATSFAFKNARVYPVRHMVAVQQRQPSRSICRASKEDEIVEKMKKQASQGDIWDSEAAGVATKVCAVSRSAEMKSPLVLGWISCYFLVPR